jgi:tetratricopeptide (TPR) repeat protein
VRTRAIRRAGLFLIVILFLLTTISATQALAEPDLIIESELRYMFDAGGGDVTITVQGELAQDIRQDIFEDYSLSENSYILEDSQNKYIEAMEDLLEMNINDARKGIEGFDYDPKKDYDPEYVGVDYSGEYQIIDLGSTGRADIKSVNGLTGTDNNDTSKFTIEMDIKGELIDDSKITLTDGYIILYSLWGEKIDLNSVEVQETTKITLIGTNGFSNLEFDSGGEFTKYRLILGEYIEYNHKYKLNGYELSNKKSDTASFDTFNPIESSLMLAIFVIVFTIIASMIGKFFAKKNNLERVRLLKVIAGIFFLILAIIYILGFDGVILMVITIMFFVLNVILAVGVYEKGWGNLSSVTIKHEDFYKEPPKIEEGPWHERGISNARVGNFQEAINCFENALESEPENAIIWNDLGFSHRKLGNTRQAIDSFNKALQLRPNYPTAQENLQKAKQEMAMRRRRKR